MSDSEVTSIRAAHGVHLARLLEAEYGIAASTLLEPLGWTVDCLAQPEARLTGPEAGRLLERAAELTGDPSLGIRMGARAPVPLLGLLGFVLLTAATLRDALQQMIDLVPAQSDAVRFNLMVDAPAPALYIGVRGDFGTHAWIAVVAIVVGLAEIAFRLTGHVIPLVAELALDRPDGWLDDALPDGMRVVFGGPDHRVVFVSQDLDRPIVSAEPVAHQLVVAQVHERLARLPKQASLAERVRRVLSEEPALTSSAEVARKIGVSERALRRQLSEAGTTFREQRDDALRRAAITLLERPELGLEEIAERLGFADGASFSRAFARWVGEPPGRFRRGRGS